MTLSKILAVAAVTLPFYAVSMPADAATAHNSQAGAWGPNKNNCDATPYFREGGCLSSLLTGSSDDVFGQPPAVYRERRPLRAPDD